MAGKDDKLGNGKAVIENIGAAVKFPRKSARLFSGGGKGAQVVALGSNGRLVRMPRTFRVAQHQQCFSYRCVFPIIVRLTLADLKNRPGNAASLIRLFKEDRYRGGVYSRIRIRWRNFKGAVVRLECLAKELLVLRIHAP